LKSYIALATSNLGIIFIILVGLALLKIHLNGGWNAHNPSLHGKVIIVTGGNTGLGFESAKKFAELKPKKIILACRDKTRGTNAVNDIKNTTGF